MFNILGKLIKSVENLLVWVLCWKIFESKVVLLLEVIVWWDYVCDKDEGKVGVVVNLSKICVNEEALYRIFGCVFYVISLLRI